MKWLFDEGTDIGHATVMLEYGDQVEFVHALMSGAEDEFVLEHSHVVGRLVCCEDKDFGELVVRRGLPASGVVLLRLNNMRRSEALSRFRQVYVKHREHFAGHLTVISRVAVRFRKLGNSNP